MCCGRDSSCRKHEKRIQVPQLIGAGGSLYPHREPFSLTWLYTKMLFWLISVIINVYCYITCTLDSNYYAFFLYYNNWVLLISCCYFTISLILCIRIYQNTQPYHLPSFLQPIDQYARSNINDLPSIKNLKLSMLYKYTEITFHLSVTNTFVLCVAYWVVEFAHSIHDFAHFYQFPMQLNVISNYALLFLLVFFDYSINASRLHYSSIWYILVMTVIFHIWSAVFNYNAFLYQNDNDNLADISRLPRLFIYYNWDQTTGDNDKITSHSLVYIVFISMILYTYIIVTHFALCFAKSFFLYSWSKTNQALIEHAFETEFELNEFSDATALDEDMVQEKMLRVFGSGDDNRHVIGNGIVVHEKIRDTQKGTDGKEKQWEKEDVSIKD